MRRRGSVSGDAIWRGDEETHEARRAARSTHPLRRGAERGRGEAEEGRGVSGDDGVGSDVSKRAAASVNAELLTISVRAEARAAL